jgi:hypothetical protein
MFTDVRWVGFLPPIFTYQGAITLSIVTLSIKTYSIKGLFVTLSINDTHITALCHDGDSGILFIVILPSVILLNVVMLSVVAPLPTYV